MHEPIRFTPLYQPRVWGGRRFHSLLGHALPDAQPYGESWEICDRAEAQSVVRGGSHDGKTLHEIWTQHRAEIFGRRYASHPAVRFPILLKTLDCTDTLSIQVHPSEALASQLNGEPKTEMWFIAHAESSARVHAGLKRGTTRAVFEKALIEGTVAGCIHSVTPQEGEFMFVPGGRLHALGGGLLIYEIQQNSDTTYRVFDWNRAGLDGKPRALHVAESLRCIDFDDIEPVMQKPAVDGTLASCSYFAAQWRQLEAGQAAPLKTEDDFLCIAVTKGRGTIAGQRAGAGDFLLLPASLSPSPRRTEADQHMEWLEIRLP